MLRHGSAQSLERGWLPPVPPVTFRRNLAKTGKVVDLDNHYLGSERGDIGVQPAAVALANPSYQRQFFAICC